MISRDMLGCLYEGSTIPRDVIQDVINFGDVELLCKLIEDGDSLLWQDQQARKYIAQIIRNGDGLRRGSGMRSQTRLIKARRDDWILARICYWHGFGLPVYGTNKSAEYIDACKVVAGELERIGGEFNWPIIDADSIVNIWKKNKPQPEFVTLQNEYGKLLRDAALSDASLRGKIKLEFCFDVDRVLGGIK